MIQGRSDLNSTAGPTSRKAEQMSVDSLTPLLEMEPRSLRRSPDRPSDSLSEDIGFGANVFFSAAVAYWREALTDHVIHQPKILASSLTYPLAPC